ncbi:hypothetical protein E2C01_048525 [Portunus trituberculatus]|uniref:Uncharacterized protein n=1 Tax=Portunus trituberculatus TaxID=210409 RepID=A0A5B7G6N2_PORTR|nr:hypothetical protein [Portunus trituberculatus]
MNEKNLRRFVSDTHNREASGVFEGQSSRGCRSAGSQGARAGGRESWLVNIPPTLSGTASFRPLNTLIAPLPSPATSLPLNTHAVRVPHSYSAGRNIHRGMRVLPSGLILR